jgi:hypothetical protein
VVPVGLWLADHAPRLVALGIDDVVDAEERDSTDSR